MFFPIFSSAISVKHTEDARDALYKYIIIVVVMHYRPIPNFNFVSKLVEIVVVKQQLRLTFSIYN